MAGAMLNLDPNSSIPISYHSRFGDHPDLLLLEVDDHLLPDFLHHRISIRGEPNEDAVLCTSSDTYALKFVGTSNSVFLVPPADVWADSGEGDCTSTRWASILKVSSGSMELVRIAPKLDKLKHLLHQKPYKPEEEEEDEYGNVNNMQPRTRIYQWSDLINIIQASDEELRAGLKALLAVEINGYWRVVDERSMSEVLRSLLNNSNLYEWLLTSLNETEVIASLEADGFSCALAFHCLETFGNRKENEGDGAHVWSLDERRICLHFAKQVLSSGRRKIESFLEEWNRRIPIGMQTSLDMLEGEVLMEKIGLETWVRAFSISSLPYNPEERFAALFRERQKWEWRDLHPYIRDLKVPGLSLEGLLIKYTRKIQPTADAEPIFSAR